MGTSGWANVVELNHVSINQLVVKSWLSASEKLAAIKSAFSGIVPILDGLNLYYYAKLDFGTLPPEFAAGLKDQPIHAAVYAAEQRRFTLQISLAVNLDLRLELRFPDDIAKYAEAGQFMHSAARAIWTFEADAKLTEAGTGNESVAIDVSTISLKKITFLDNEPTDSVRRAIERIARMFLPKFMDTAKFAITPLYGELRGIGMTPAFADFEVRTLDSGGNSVTGSLQGDDRFAPSLRSFIAIGLRYGFDGKAVPAHAPIPFILPSRPDQTLALTVSQWSLQYANAYTTKPLIAKAVSDKLGDRSPRGLMMIDVLHGGGITNSDDDGILVITDVHGLCWDLPTKRFKVVIEAYDIQRGLFGWDELAPDIHLTIWVSVGVRPNDQPGNGGAIDFTQPIIEPEVEGFKKHENWWTVVTAPFVMAQKLINGLANVISGNWSAAAKDGAEMLLAVPMLVSTIGFFICLFGGVSLKNDTIGIPKLKFIPGQEVALEVRTPMENISGGSGDFTGATIFMTMR